MKFTLSWTRKSAAGQMRLATVMASPNLTGNDRDGLKMVNTNLFGNIMRTTLTIVILIAGLLQLEVRATTNEVLLAAQYDPAEAVFHQFLHTLPKQGWRTNFVYCLSYGTSNSPLPSDFMTRFAGTPLRIITDTNALFFSSSGKIVERASGQAAVILSLRALAVKGNRADASVHWIDSSRAIANVFHFVKQDGRWQFVDGTEQSIDR